MMITHFRRNDMNETIIEQATLAAYEKLSDKYWESQWLIGELSLTNNE